MDDEHRHRRVGDNRRGDAPEQVAGQPGATVRADHNQAGLSGDRFSLIGCLT
jgi:hypothetical protein